MQWHRADPNPPPRNTIINCYRCSSSCTINIWRVLRAPGELAPYTENVNPFSESASILHAATRILGVIPTCDRSGHRLRKLPHVSFLLVRILSGCASSRPVARPGRCVVGACQPEGLTK